MPHLVTNMLDSCDSCCQPQQILCWSWWFVDELRWFDANLGGGGQGEPKKQHVTYCNLCRLMSACELLFLWTCVSEICNIQFKPCVSCCWECCFCCHMMNDVLPFAICAIRSCHWLPGWASNWMWWCWLVWLEKQFDVPLEFIGLVVEGSSVCYWLFTLNASNAVF